MINLWDLFVDQIAGGFWLSVLLLIFIQMLIMFMGGLSANSIFNYILFFAIAMCFGYGYPLIIVVVFGIVLYYAVSQYMGWAERSGGN